MCTNPVNVLVNSSSAPRHSIAWAHECVLSVSANASASTRSRMYGDRPFSVTTSTLQPSRSSRSCRMAIKSSRLRFGSNPTRRSRSLPGVESPRARDPNTRTEVAPCSRATRKISATGKSKLQLRLGAQLVGAHGAQHTLAVGSSRCLNEPNGEAPGTVTRRR